MIQLEITDYSSADIDQVWEWVPKSEMEVFFQLTIEISEIGLEGGNLFQLVVATPEGLRAYADKYNRSFPDRALLVLSHYSWECLEERLKNIVLQCSKGDWNTSISCLQKFFQWEYEDYQQE